MPGRQAKILSDAEVDSMLAWYEKRRYPHRDKVAVLISVKAGLRVMKTVYKRASAWPNAGSSPPNWLYLATAKLLAVMALVS